jgi:hypothetical protein
MITTPSVQTGHEAVYKLYNVALSRCDTPDLTFRIHQCSGANPASYTVSTVDLSRNKVVGA